MDALSTGPTDLSTTFLHLTRDGGIEEIVSRGPGHPDVEGRLAGEARMKRSPPHGGEMHPDGDELLYLIEGNLDVSLDAPGGGQQTVSLTSGDAFVVPRGVWHRVIVKEPCRLLFLTPGKSKVRGR